MFGRPFELRSKIHVVLPNIQHAQSQTEAQQLTGLKKLLEEHRSALERELGASFEFANALPPPFESAWIIGPSRCNPSIAALGHSSVDQPTLHLDRSRAILVSDGSNATEVIETFSYLRSLSGFNEGTWTIQDCESVESTITRIQNEVRHSYPAFKLRGLDWNEICRVHIPKVREAADPIAAMQEWLATLQDGHTWVRPFPPQGEFPYGLWVESGKAIFTRIPEHSEAWKHGVRPGFRLIETNLNEWQRRTASSIHGKPLLVGRRVLTSPIEQKRHFKAEALDASSTVEWNETSRSDIWSPLVTWKKLPSGNGYLQIRAWLLGKNVEDQIEEAIQFLRSCPKLIVDLRGNPGGNLLMAHRFRNRFLDSDRIVGWIQNTLPNGELSEKEALRGERAPAEQRWNGEVRFLTDPLTYSASEDALLGLQGQKKVKVVGLPSGGGSGRMRMIRLMPGWRLTISTALTYDLQGRCIEGSGIPVDVEVPMDFKSLNEDHALSTADRI